MTQIWTDPSQRMKSPMANNLIDISPQKYPITLTFVRKYFPPTNRCDVSHLERRTARGVAPRPTSCVGCVDVWLHMHVSRIGYVEMHGWMEIIRSGGHAALSLRCLSLRLDNRPSVEKSSCPIRSHQFSLGVRPYAPWYWHLDPAKTRPTIDRFHDAPVITHRMLTFDSMTIGHWFGLQIEFRGIFVSLDVHDSVNV